MKLPLMMRFLKASVDEEPEPEPPPTVPLYRPFDMVEYSPKEFDKLISAMVYS
jgi:hypothetical protein